MAFKNFIRKVLLYSSNNILQNPNISVSPNSVTNFPFPKFYSSGCADNLSKPFRHGYPVELEDAVNGQIQAEFNASMVYLSMYCHYGRTDVALPGCQSFFKAMYDEEQEHAQEFIDYQLMRGGQVQLYPLTVPNDMDWEDVTIAFGVSLEMEKRVKEKLETLARMSETHNDLQLADFIISKFLKEQNESICEMGRLLTKAKRLVDSGGVGRQIFDKEVFKYVKDKHPDVKLHYKNI